jgi:hypothetical protein
MKKFLIPHTLIFRRAFTRPFARDAGLHPAAGTEKVTP